jgi:hypothetical protein
VVRFTLRADTVDDRVHWIVDVQEIVISEPEFLRVHRHPKGIIDQLLTDMANTGFTCIELPVSHLIQMSGISFFHLTPAS